MQNWKKLGLILSPGKYEWMTTHCSIPITKHLHDNIFRIYFYGRNKQNQSQVGFCEIDITKPQEILHITPKPVLEVGEKGHFDESGIMASSIIENNGELWMYYIGWIQGVTVPFYVYVGLAISKDDGQTFQRHSPAPILGRHKYDPILTASPTVMIEGDLWRMWYISATKWEKTDDKPKHFYNVRYTESKDGINWERNGHIAIDYKDEEEYAIARPSVIKENGIYKMWFSYRGGPNPYRIGYAESQDGINWNRKDEEVNLNASPEGWDSEMICYCQVFKHNDQTYMLYNGNNYGATGLGLAILEN